MFKGAGRVFATAWFILLVVVAWKMWRSSP